jgi:hypothetical protein
MSKNNVEDCPYCGLECLSSNIMNGVYIFWCDECHKQFGGNYIVDMDDFSLDVNCNG